MTGPHSFNYDNAAGFSILRRTIDPSGSATIVNALLSAPILFFVLGAAIAAAGARLPWPDGFGKAVAAYLLVAIGLKGGVALSGADVGTVLPLVAVSGLLSLTMPLLAFVALRRLAGLGRIDAAAVAAHYGSVSLVTFVAATEALRAADIAFGAHMVAALAVMEAPAIVTGLVLAGAGAAGAATRTAGGAIAVAPSPDRSGFADAVREACLNGSILLLLGALAVGALVGEAGMAQLHGLFVAPWNGVLCLFLLEMGHVAARRLTEAATLGPRLVVFGVAMPLTGAAIGLAAAHVLGLSTGDAVLLVTLAASASYIAVPAALRSALPEADQGISLPLALGITFPFNVTVGVPLYLWAVRTLA